MFLFVLLQRVGFVRRYALDGQGWRKVGNGLGGDGFGQARFASPVGGYQPGDALPHERHIRGIEQEARVVRQADVQVDGMAMVGARGVGRECR